MQVAPSSSKPATNWIDSFIPQMKDARLEDLVRCRLLIWFNLVVPLIGFSVLTASVLFDHQRITIGRIALVLFSSIMLYNPFLLKRSGSIPLVGALTLTCVGIPAALVALTNNGLLSQTFPVLLALPILGAFMLGARGGAIITALVSIYSLYLAIAQTKGWLPPAASSAEANHYIRLVLTIMGLMIIGAMASTLQLFNDRVHRDLLEEIENHRATGTVLKQTSSEAQQAVRAKSSFLATMSHELRTPMNGILGFCGLLLENELTPDARRQAEAIKQSAESLLVILNDILDFSKLEQGMVKLDPHDFDLPALLQQITNILQPMAATKGLGIASHVSKDIPAFVYGDSHRLRQVLLNLINNSIKFSDKGAIIVEVDLKQRTTDRVLLKFSVIDQGIGMSEDVQSRLFERFMQADNSISRRYGGTGLGLSICRELVELMGGNIGVQSQLGVGSRFWFTAEFVVSDVSARTAPTETDVLAQSLPTQIETTKALDILVVEDNAVNQKLVTALLTKKGHQVTLATNGGEAVWHARDHKFDVILMDVQMPIMNGLDATKIIRATPNANNKTPIIALTANAMEGDRETCLATGMTDYVSKPIKPAELYAAMAKVVS